MRLPQNALTKWVLFCDKFKNLLHTKVEVTGSLDVGVMREQICSIKSYVFYRFDDNHILKGHPLGIWLTDVCRSWLAGLESS